MKENLVLFAARCMSEFYDVIETYKMILVLNMNEVNNKPFSFVLLQIIL